MVLVVDTEVVVMSCSLLPSGRDGGAIAHGILVPGGSSAAKPA